MKDYYDILDVPLNASIEQIKTRYKQLVRIYHPDRFNNALDKVYAEHKLKQVNEAYAYLTSDTEGITFFNTFAKPPLPVVEPAILDFGVLKPGEQQVLRFEVSNAGGPASGVTFVCSEENGWFRISNGRRLEPSKTLPMVFEVIADIRPTFLPRYYGGWIEISIDGVIARVELQVEVQEPAAHSTFQLGSLPLPTWQLPALQTRYRLLALVGIFCLLAVLLNTQISRSAVELFNSFRITQSALLVSAASEPTATSQPVQPTDLPPTATLQPAPPATLAVVSQTVELAIVEPLLSPTATPTALATLVPQGRVVSPAQERSALLPTTNEELAPGAVEATLAALPLDATTLALLNPITPTAAATVTPTPPATVTPAATEPPPTATPVATATQPPLPTSTPTSPPTPSPTPLPTATATVAAEPSATPLPGAGLYQILLADGSLRQAVTLEIPADYTVNVRYAWDIRSPAVAVLVGGTRLPAIGRSIDGAWVEVALPNGQIGWIFTDVLEIDLAQIEPLPLTLAPSWP